MPEAVETGPAFPGTAGVMPAFRYVGGSAILIHTVWKRLCK